jgi:hypothetical protein
MICFSFLQGCFRFCSAATTLFLFGIVVVSGAGCQSGDRSEVAVKSAAVQSAQPGGSLLRINTNLPALYLEKNDLLDVEKATYKDKLVLQLYHQKDSTLFLLAVHPASRKNLLFDEAKIKYPKPFANGLDFSGQNIFLGDQQTKKGELEKLLSEVKKYALIRYVVFVPKVDGDQHLYYEITGVEKLATGFGGNGFRTATYSSSPTPPAKLR